MLALWQDTVGVRNGTQCTVMAELAHAPQPPARALGGGAGWQAGGRSAPERFNNLLEQKRGGEFNLCVLAVVSCLLHLVFSYFSYRLRT